MVVKYVVFRTRKVFYAVQLANNEAFLAHCEEISYRLRDRISTEAHRSILLRERDSSRVRAPSSAMENVMNAQTISIRVVDPSE